MTAARATTDGDVEDLLREAAPRVLAAVVRRFGDFGDSEDAVQEAMIDAARQWPAQGTPESPTGWLIHVASRRMTDRIRSDSARRGARGRGSRPTAEARRPRPEPATADDTLVADVHVLPPGADPGLGDRPHPARGRRPDHGRDRRAFLVPEATMAQRISRAKQTHRGLAGAVPDCRRADGAGGAAARGAAASST